MILTCPSCATRYLVDPVLFPPEGRTVRCASCAHSWHELPPPDIPKKIDFAPPPVLQPIPKGSNLPVLAEPPRKRSGGIWIFLIFLLAAVLAGGWIGRARLVEIWPPAGKLYEWLHIPVEQPARLGLILQNLSSSTALEGGRPVLVITGEVANVIDETRITPKLRVSLRDAERREIKSWEITLPDPEIKARDKVTFSNRYPDPPPEARDLEITFLSDRGKSDLSE